MTDYFPDVAAGFLAVILLILIMLWILSIVSQKLHISQATLKKWIKNGELRGVKILKIGAVTRFESSSFKEFMEKRYS